MSLSLGSRLLLCLFIAITTGDVVRGQVAGPNAVALINDQTMLDCNTFNLAASNWQRTPDGTSNFITIASGCIVSGNNAAYYRTEQPGANICRLVIANVTMQQAGVYSCYNGASTTYNSLVTVIDPAASVVYKQTGVVAGDQLNISCSINYNGPQSPAPSIRPLPSWITSPGQIYTSATYHPSTIIVTLMATVTVQKPKVPIFQCNTVFEIAGSTSGYNSTPPADSFTVGNTTEIDVQSSQTSAEPSTESASTATITTTNGACSCDPVSTTAYTSNVSCAAAIPIALGVILFISVVMNIFQMIFLIRNLRDKQDPYKRTGTILQPEILDLSNGTSAPAAYEELRRPTEFDLLPITYEQLKPKPPIYMNRLS